MTARTVRSLAAAAALAAISAQPRALAAPPKLVVMLVVDQMRADYVDRFQNDWTGGLKRLVSEGAWFRRAAYPYLTTVTCAGHATIATGAFPHVHGMFQNEWWDREVGKQMHCVEDLKAFDIGYSSEAEHGRESAWRLLVPTFADVMRETKSAHVVSLAIKDRSAIMLAGHAADAATWLGDAVDGWVTSSAFAKAPVPAVKAFVDANPINADFHKSWTPKLPESSYQEADDQAGEAPPPGWTRVFPHVLGENSKEPDTNFYGQWQRSPYADAYVGRFAAALTESMKLGRHDGTDILAVGFSSPDMVGHGFGPKSREVRDMFVRLDETLGALFARLDTLVGRDNYVVALTSDHGVSAIPEQAREAGGDAGRVPTASLAQAIERAAASTLGGGPYIASIASNDIYFKPGLYEKLVASPAALDAVIKAIEQVPGISRVWRGESLRNPATAYDALTRAAALTYVPGRSGDLIFARKPGWMTALRGTTHGSPSPDDQRVPILLIGPGIKPGRYDDAATPADIAPTLAALCGVTLPRAEGRPLTAALR